MDRVFPEVLAYDGARPELDAAFRVVDELVLVEAVDLRRANVQTRLRVAGPADLRVDRGGRFLGGFELVQADPVVHRQGLRRVLLGRLARRRAVESKGRVVNRR